MEYKQQFDRGKTEIEVQYGNHGNSKALLGQRYSSSRLLCATAVGIFDRQTKAAAASLFSASFHFTHPLIYPFLLYSSTFTTLSLIIPLQAFFFFYTTATSSPFSASASSPRYLRLRVRTLEWLSKLRFVSLCLSLRLAFPHLRKHAKHPY